MDSFYAAPVRNLLCNGEALELIHSEVLFIKDMPVKSIFLVVSGAVLVFADDGSRLRRCVGSQQIVGIYDALACGSWRGIGVAHGSVKLIAFNFENLQKELGEIQRAHRVLLDDLFAA